MKIKLTLRKKNMLVCSLDEGSGETMGFDIPDAFLAFSPSKTSLLLAGAEAS